MIAWVLGILTALALGFFLYMTGYTNGFCDALHGQPLNGYTCNVDGKVVSVR